MNFTKIVEEVLLGEAKGQYGNLIVRALRSMSLPATPQNVEKVRGWIDYEDSEWGSMQHTEEDIRELIDARGEFLPHETEEDVKGVGFKGKGKGRYVYDTQENKLYVGDRVAYITLGFNEKTYMYHYIVRLGTLKKILDREQVLVQYDRAKAKDTWTSQLHKLDANGELLDPGGAFPVYTLKYYRDKGEFRITGSRKPPTRKK